MLVSGYPPHIIVTSFTSSFQRTYPGIHLPYLFYEELDSSSTWYPQYRPYLPLVKYTHTFRKAPLSDYSIGSPIQKEIHLTYLIFYFLLILKPITASWSVGFASPVIPSHREFSPLYNSASSLHTLWTFLSLFSTFSFAYFHCLSPSTQNSPTKVRVIFSRV